MSSRARRVDDQARPYDWQAKYSAPPPVHPVDAITPTESAPTESAAVETSDEESPAVAGELLSHQQRLAELERDAFAKGYAQGERAGLEAAGTRANAMLRRLAQTIEELASTRDDLIRRTEHQVVQFALAVARQILDRELHVDRDLLLAMARVALDRLGQQAAATIRLHPDDHAIVMASPAREWTSDQVQVVADSAVGRGGCLVQSDFGVMDVGLDGQFGELARALLGEHAAVPAAAAQNLDGLALSA
jgi:flagellar assembly protein FliH